MFLALLAGAGTSGLFLGPSASSLKAAAAVLLVLGAWRPGAGLLVLAGAVPLGGALSALAGSPHSWATPLALALLAGAALRIAVRPPSPSDPGATAAAGLWIAVVLSSAAADLWLQASLGLAPSETVRDFGRWLLLSSPATQLAQYATTTAAVLAATGAGVFALVAWASRQDPTLPRRLSSTLAFSGAAAGALAVYRLVEVALRHPPTAVAFEVYAGTLRLSPVVPDVNAASALYLMLLTVVVGLAGDRASRWAVAAVPGLLAGIWIAGSRTALALLPVALVVVAAVPYRERLRSSRLLRAGIAVGLLSVLVLVPALFLARPGAHGDPGAAMEIRRDLTTTSLRMLRDDPVFGVGVGAYYRESPRYMTPALLKRYTAQNAHNQVLQIAAELGVTGLAAFGALLWVALAPAVLAIWRHRASPSLLGLTVGLLAFLLVSLGMHPLLIPEVSLTFFLLLGAARAEGVACLGRDARRRTTWTLVALAAALAACVLVPWRAAALARSANLEDTSYGLSAWTQSGGRTWRSSRLPAVFFLPASAGRILVPLRVRTRGGLEAPPIQVLIDGRLTDALHLPPGVWTSTPFVMPPPARDDGRFRRVELRWNAPPPPGTLVDVGRRVGEAGAGE